MAAAGLALAGIVACGQHKQFTVLPLYSKNDFSGKDLNGQQITVLPLLTQHGPMSNDILRPEKLIAAAAKDKSGLLMRQPYEFLERFAAKFGGGALDSVYGYFYAGRMIALKSNDSLWKEINTGFLMLFKLTYGLTAKIDPRKTVRRMRLEGELWDCDSVEVVWRTAVDARCEGNGTSDSKLIFQAMRRIVGALPALTPGYGRNAW
jgi:hypothetical protein